jgi:hypothetical protein
MSTEKEVIEAQKKEGKDTTELEAKSLDERARGYFKKMVKLISSRCLPTFNTGV